jgi:hypothetical protein
MWNARGETSASFIGFVSGRLDTGLICFRDIADNWMRTNIFCACHLFLEIVDPVEVAH